MPTLRDELALTAVWVLATKERETAAEQAAVDETFELLADEGRKDHIDQHQRECVMKAMSTPHFTVIEGPPESVEPCVGLLGEAAAARRSRVACKRD